MDVFIVTESGRDSSGTEIGYGHLTRCLAIAQAFEERSVTATLIVSGDEESKAFVDGHRHEFFDWTADPARLVARIKRHDVVVIDSYKAPRDLYQNIGRRADLVLCVFDHESEHARCPRGGIVVNATFNAERKTFERAPNVEYLLGSRYVSIRREFWDMPERPVQAKPSNVLVTFGGHDLRNLTPGVVKKLRSTFPDVAFRVVVGSGFTNRKEIESLPLSGTVMVNAPDARGMRDTMVDCDVAVSAAGQTLYELARSGVPTVAVQVVDNQRWNDLDPVPEEEETGSIRSFLIDVIPHDAPALADRIVAAVRRGVRDGSQEVRTALAAAGRRLVDGQGARRVVESVLRWYCARRVLFLRRATESDSDIVYALSNDPDVRQQSINREPIPRDHHQRWYAQRISDPAYDLFVASNAANRFIGQVKFQVKGSAAVISISVAKEFRGQGLSAQILTLACHEVFDARPNVGMIRAYIRSDNIASVKGFEKAAFSFAGTPEINGEQFLLYTLER